MPPRKPRPAVPPYARIRDDLKRALARGRYPPGARMPSEAELVRRNGVSRMTVTRALRELSDDGLVQRVQGAGTFAAQPHRVASQLWIRDIHEEILARGKAHEKADFLPLTVVDLATLSLGSRPELPRAGTPEPE